MNRPSAYNIFKIFVVLICGVILIIQPVSLISASTIPMDDNRLELSVEPVPPTGFIDFTNHSAVESEKVPSTISDSFLYGVWHNQLFIFNIGGGMIRMLSQTHLGTRVEGRLTVFENNLIVPKEHNFEIWNVSNPELPFPVGDVNFPQNSTPTFNLIGLHEPPVYSVDTSHLKVVVNSTVFIFDLSDDSFPLLRTQVIANGSETSVFGMQGEYIFFNDNQTNDNQTTYLSEYINSTNNANSSSNTNGNLQLDSTWKATDSYLYNVIDHNTLVKLNIIDPVHPSEHQKLTFDEVYIGRRGISDSHAILLDAKSGTDLYIVDIEDDMELTCKVPKDVISQVIRTAAIETKGDYIYMFHELGILQVYSINSLEGCDFEPSAGQKVNNFIFDTIFLISNIIRSPLIFIILILVATYFLIRKWTRIDNE